MIRAPLPRRRANGASSDRPVRAARAARGRSTLIESIDIRTRDGWSLRADLHAPPAAGASSRRVAVLAHALMARRGEFYRPRGESLTELLVERGWTVVAFDFRGHGDSRPCAPAAAYGYDDLVSRDLAAVCEFAREQAGPAGAVVVVGHSLGGHTALVAQGSGAIAVDAIVGLAAAPPFVRDDEPSLARWALKRATLASMAALARGAGRFPARLLGLGSDDESRACCEDFERFARTGRWVSADGRVDYLAALRNVRVPVMQVLTDGDRFECVPVCGERFIARCSGPREILRVAQDDDGGRPPTHMGLVTSGNVRSVWERIEVWMSAAASRISARSAAAHPRQPPS